MRRSLLSLGRAVPSRLVLGLIAVLACVGITWGARQVLPPPLRAPAREANAEPIDAVDAARARLARFDAERRSATDFAHLPPANLTHGADPYALARLDARHLVGVLRGASALVLLDDELHELQRIELSGSALAVTVTDAGECWVAGETSHTVQQFHFDGRVLKSGSTFDVPGILGVRALLAGPGGLLYALDVHDGRLLSLQPVLGELRVRDSRVIGHGPLSLRRIGSFLIVDLLLDHALVVYRLNERGQVLDERARVSHDGPIWGFDAALLSEGELLIAATGVEDHPLVRGDEGFGYIDSFAFSYLLPKVGAARELWRLNVSELGVVTPKAPVLHVVGSAAELFVSGYGSDHAALLGFDARAERPPSSKLEAWVPGASAALRLDSGALAFADPLLDAWLLRPARALLAGAAEPSLELRPVLSERSPKASPEERLGEALFFTTLIAPTNSSDGAHSRFSCETCHFEGYVDGRVHYTGRADVHATTKPLRGLFNNRPHFSRALDPDLATVSHHEFRVAGTGNGKDPWFELETASYPWLEPLGVTETTLSAEALRRALMAFLMGFSHTPNPAVSGRSAFNPAERRGAERFRERCARCHAARLQSDVPESALPFEAWQSAIFSPEGPIVWASADYQKTGVTPYVHEAGARVPSLRRLYTKWPRFTNGSADTLRDVLIGARYDETRFFHANPPTDATLHALTSEEVSDLGAFLDLL